MKALLLTYCLFLITVSCEKRKEICQWSHFTFEHPVSVYPIKESYNIGDTIWFEMNFLDVFNASVRNNYNGQIRYEKIQLKDFDFQKTKTDKGNLEVQHHKDVQKVVELMKRTYRK